MNEVMLVSHHLRSNGEYEFFVALFDLVKRSQDNDPIYPEIVACDTVVDKTLSFSMCEALLEIGADNVLAGSIYEIPIIDTRSMSHIKFPQFL